MSLFTILWLLSLSCVASIASAQRLEKILDQVSQRSVNFSSINYDDLNDAILLDQIDNYRKPIKSLNTRSVKLLNGLYDFCLDPQAEGFNAKWQEQSLVAACPKANYFKMPVPSAFNDIPTEERVKNYMGWMWYQTEVSSQTPEHSEWFLQFENINYMCMIWVQDVDWISSAVMSSHVGGHLPIVVDISSLVEKHGSGYIRLRLTIAVSNMLTDNTIPSGRMVNLTTVVGRPYFKFEPDFDFFHFAGIMGDVQLIRLPAVYIESVSYAPTSDDPLSYKLEICFNQHWEAETHLIGQAIGKDSGVIRFRSWHSTDPNRLNIRVTSCSDTIIRFSAGSKLELRIKLSNSSRHNDFYQVLDIFELKLRRLSSLSSIRNESSGQLQGFGTHHEQLFSGRTMSLAAIMKDLYLMRQVGANVLRTSHYPYSRAYLDACDELGIAVIAECPAVGLRSFSESKLRLHKQIMLEMMERDRDHSAIVMWSVANEPESQLEGAREYFKQLLEFVRKQPARGGRPLTAAIAQSHAGDTIGDLLDVVMINRYFGWYEQPAVLESIRPGLMASLIDGWAKKLGADKPLLISEFGADTLSGLHSATGEHLFSEEYQRALVVEHERVFDELAANRSRLNFLGAMLWNFADFSTHESLGRVGGNRKGVFTRDREPKLAAGAIREIFTRRRAGQL